MLYLVFVAVVSFVFGLRGDFVFHSKAASLLDVCVCFTVPPVSPIPVLQNFHPPTYLYLRPLTYLLIRLN